jgi:hypothetical protein
MGRQRDLQTLGFLPGPRQRHARVPVVARRSIAPRGQEALRSVRRTSNWPAYARRPEHAPFLPSSAPLRHYGVEHPARQDGCVVGRGQSVLPRRLSRRAAFAFPGRICVAAHRVRLCPTDRSAHRPQTGQPASDPPEASAVISQTPPQACRHGEPGETFLRVRGCDACRCSSGFGTLVRPSNGRRAACRKYSARRPAAANPSASEREHGSHSGERPWSAAIDLRTQPGCVRSWKPECS